MFINRMLRSPEGTEGAGGAAPAAVTAPATPVAPVVKTTETVVTDPAFLSDRIERERRATLKKLGIKAPKDAPIDQVIAEARTKNEGRKEKLRAAEAAQATAEAKAASLEGQVAALKTYAGVELSLLTESQRKLVTELAGDDPAEQLKQIAAIKKIASESATAHAATATAAVANELKALAAPATTTTASHAPDPAHPSNQQPLKKQLADLRAISDPTKRALSVALFAVNNADALLSDS